MPPHRRLGYVPGDVTLWRNPSGGEIADLVGKLGGGPAAGLAGPRRRDLTG